MDNEKNNVSKQKYNDFIGKEGNDKTIKCFIDETEETFSEFFEKHVEKHLLDRTDYLELTKQKNLIYNKYPQIRNFIQDKIPMNFDVAETEALYELMTIFSKMNDLEIVEAYKLGARDCYIFMEEMDMLKI